MKRVIRSIADWEDSIDAIFGMANLVPKNTGLKVDIWSPHKGGSEKLPHNSTRIKITKGNSKVSITVEPHPQIKAEIDKYSNDVKQILDKDWRENLWMTIFPLEGEYYIDRDNFCSAEKPENHCNHNCSCCR